MPTFCVGRVRGRQVPCETLLTAINRMVTNDQESGVLFAFRRGGLTLTSCAKETGAAKVTIPLTFNGTVEFVLDVSFIKDYFRSLDTETVIGIFMAVGDEPVLFTTDGGAYRYVVMPMSRAKTAYMRNRL